MIAALGALGLPIAAVWLVLGAVGGLGLRGHRGTRIALAVLLGLGLSSLETFWLVGIGRPLDATFLVVDAVIWIGLTAAAVIWHRRHSAGWRHEGPPTEDRQNGLLLWLARAGFVAVAATVVATVAAHYTAAPHGDWDAWAIWNQKARFLVRGGAQWTDGLTIIWSNPTHPMLLSAAVARLWVYTGAEPTVAPALVAALFGLAIVSGMVGAIGAAKPRAWVAGAAVMAPGFFPQLASAQTSDQPLGAFMLLALVMLRHATLSGHRADETYGTRAAAVGLLVGLGLWTKNEGAILMLVSIGLLGWGLPAAARLRSACGWAVGSVPGVATLLYLRTSIALSSSMYNAGPMTTAQLVGQFLDPERHLLIWRLLIPNWTRWGGPMASGCLVLVTLAVVYAAFFRRSATAHRVGVAAIAMMAGYYAAYLALPHDTSWLVATTFDRLTMQLWPSLVLAAFMDADEAAPARRAA